jgi:hypothetical protein
VKLVFYDEMLPLTQGLKGLSNKRRSPPVLFDHEVLPSRVSHLTISISFLPAPPSPSASASSTAASTTSYPAHTLVVAISTLITPVATAKVLALGLSSSVASAVLHAREHGAHLAGVHLGGVHAHLLHELLHLGVHPRHAPGATGASSTGASSRVTACAAAGTSHVHATHHHHVIEVVHHLLVIGRPDVSAKLRAHTLLLLRIECPGEFIEAVVEVVADVGTRLAPRLLVVWEVCVPRELALLAHASCRATNAPSSMLTCVMGFPVPGYTGFALMSMVDFDAAAEVLSALGVARCVPEDDVLDSSFVGAGLTVASLDVDL